MKVRKGRIKEDLGGGKFLVKDVFSDTERIVGLSGKERQNYRLIEDDILIFLDNDFIDLERPRPMLTETKFKLKHYVSEVYKQYLELKNKNSTN